MQTSRPSGIAILTLLQCFGAVGWIAIGTMVTFGGALSSMAGWAGTLAVAIGVALLMIGLASIVVAYGLWIGKGWARRLCIAIAGISIIFDALSLITGVGLVRLFIDALVIYYATRPKIKAYFSKNSHVEAGTE